MWTQEAVTLKLPSTVFRVLLFPRSASFSFLGFLGDGDFQFFFLVICTGSYSRYTKGRREACCPSSSPLAPIRQTCGLRQLHSNISQHLWVQLRSKKAARGEALTTALIVDTCMSLLPASSSLFNPTLRTKADRQSKLLNRAVILYQAGHTAQRQSTLTRSTFWAHHYFSLACTGL